MGAGDWLAGIAGVAGSAIEGGLQAHRYDQQRRDGLRQRDDDRTFQVERDKWQADIQRKRDELQAMLRNAGLLEERERDKADKEAASAAASAADGRLHDEVESSLPDHLRQPYHVGGHKGSFKPEDYVAPKTPEQLAAEEERKRKALLADFTARQQITTNMNVDQHARTSRIDQQYRTPVRPVDDPALPNGVTAYLATLPSKHGGDYAAAQRELQEQMPGLVQAHPRLDFVKAGRALDAMFSSSSRRGDDDVAAIAAAAAQEATDQGAATPGRGARPSGGTPVAALPQRPAPARSGAVPVSPLPRPGAQAAAGASPSGTSGPANEPQTVTMMELQTLATKRKTTVEQERRRAEAAGYVVR